MIPVFSMSHNVTYYDLDASGRMRLASVLRLANTASDRHCTVWGVGYDYLKTRNLVYLINRIGVRVFTMPTYDQDIEIRTWSKGIQGATFIRNGEIVDCADGGRLIEWSGVWTLADFVKHRIARPSALGLDIPHLGDNGVTVRADKISFDRSICSAPVYVHKVRFSDVDSNMHLNNIRYADILTNAMPFQDALTLDIDELCINYVSEAVQGAEIEVLVQTSGQGMKFCGQSKGANCFLAEIKRNCEAIS